jgi:hypothetical protein
MWIFNGIVNAIGSTFIGSSNYITDLFINRVKSDGGVFEAEPCLANTLNGLSQITSEDDTFPFAQYLAATGITGETQVSAIYKLMSDLKAFGLWSKMKAVYPFVTDNRNLLDYTEDFSNAAWAKSNSNVTTNTATAPNGTLTADTLSDGTLNNLHYVSTSKIAFGQNGSNTSTIYAKANTLNYLWMYFYNGSEPAGVAAWFNLSNGTVGTVQSGLTASIENVGNGWYRCSITRNFNFTAAGSNCGYGVSNSDNVNSYLGTNKSIYIWGAQLELGSTATTYQPIATTQQAYIASQFKYNLVNPVDSDAAFRLVFNGGWTHSSTGATPNGVNGYADTNFNPLTNLNVNSNHQSVYLRTENTYQNVVDIGQTDNNWLSAVYWGVAGRTYIYNPTNAILITSTTTTGSNNLSINTRRNSTDFAFFNNNTKHGTNTSLNVSSFTSGNVTLASAGGTLYFSPRQNSFTSIGDGLTDTEAANLYTIVQNFQTSLNRQV